MKVFILVSIVLSLIGCSDGNDKPRLEGDQKTGTETSDRTADNPVASSLEAETTETSATAKIDKQPDETPTPNVHPPLVADSQLNTGDGLAENSPEANPGKILIKKIYSEEIFSSIKPYITPESTSFKNDMGRTPLHIALSKENLDIVKELVGKGANVSGIDNNKETPIFGLIRDFNIKVDGEDKHPVLNPDKAVVEQLKFSLKTSYENVDKIIDSLRYDTSFDINHKNSNGDTALHVAAKAKNKDAIRVLLLHRADPSVENSKFQKPYELIPEGDSLRDLLQQLPL